MFQYPVSVAAKDKHDKLNTQFYHAYKLMLTCSFSDSFTPNLVLGYFLQDFFT